MGLFFLGEGTDGGRTWVKDFAIFSLSIIERSELYAQKL